MQEVLGQLASEGYVVDETHFEHLSPCRFEPINRLGKYSFEMALGLIVETDGPYVALIKNN